MLWFGWQASCAFTPPPAVLPAAGARLSSTAPAAGGEAEEEEEASLSAAAHAMGEGEGEDSSGLRWVHSHEAPRDSRRGPPSHNPGVQTVISSGSPGFGLYPTAHVARH